MAKSKAWPNILLDIALPICEPANIEVPEIPPRSWAYHLEPIGIGTAKTESLTSYFARLAEVHCVTPRALFKYGLSKVNNESSRDSNTLADGLVSPNDQRATQQINGSGLVAEKWVESLEGITLQKRLRFLTFLSWKAVLSNRTMGKREHAWCPACFEDQRIARLIIYEQLRWGHRRVQVCPDHAIRLETRCPHCTNSHPLLCGKSRPGICPHCNGWLGYQTNGTGLIFNEIESDKATYELFVSEQIGSLIAKAPKLGHLPKRDLPKLLITQCVDQFFDGNLNSFVRFFGFGKGATSSFSKSKTRIIDLELLLKVSFRADVTLLDLFIKPNALDGFNPSLSPTGTQNRLSPRRRKEDVHKALLTAAEEIPPPSLNELAERLGYIQANTLRRYFPEICARINLNFLESARGKNRVKFSTARRHPDEVIIAALESALNEESPPSLTYVAKSLGYNTGATLQARFPEICKALVEKRLNLTTARRSRVAGELTKALTINPPIALDTVSENLGYKGTAMLRAMYPEMCQEIYCRYENYKRTKFLWRIENELRCIMAESPPPALNDALQRLSVSDGFLRKHFPEEHRSLSTHYLKFRQEQSLKNKESDRKKIKAIVEDLINRRVYPSMNAVLKVFSASYLKRPEVWATIKQTREKFSYPM